MCQSSFSVSLVRSAHAESKRKTGRGVFKPTGYSVRLQRGEQLQIIPIHKPSTSVGQIEDLGSLALHVERGNGPFLYLPETETTISTTFPVNSLSVRNGRCFSCRTLDSVEMPYDAIAAALDGLRAKFVEKQKDELGKCAGWLTPRLELNGYFIYQVSTNARFHPAMTFFLLGENERRGAKEVRPRVLAEFSYSRETGEIRFRRKRDKSRNGYQSCALAAFRELLKAAGDSAAAVLSPAGVEGMDSVLVRDLLTAA